MPKGRFFRPPLHLHLPPWTGPFVACGDAPSMDAPDHDAVGDSADAQRDGMAHNSIDAHTEAPMAHVHAVDGTGNTPLYPGPSPYFLEQLQATRHGDAVSGGSWSNVQGMTSKAADALGHLDRVQNALATVASLLHASQQCVRRRPEDFGIGDDRHEGLIHAIRELVDAQRVHLDVLEMRAGA